MIRGLVPYSRTKPSRVAWLGDVPDHWRVAAFRAIGTAIKGRQPELVAATAQGSDLLPYLSMAFLRSSEVSPSELARPSAGIVIAERGEPILLWDGANAGEFLRAKRRGVVSSTAALVRSRELTPPFLYFACKVIEPTLRAYTVGMGIPHVDPDVLKGMQLSLPTAEEQRLIVCFLRHAERRLSDAISAKQRLIALLNEQKQAVIQRAVTRGLDPAVRLKPSGVEWLGHVPEHWQLRPLKHLVPQVTVGIVVQPAQLYVDAGVPCLRSVNISSGVIKPTPLVFISAESNRLHRKSQIFAGDIVVVRTGRAGVAAIVSPDFDGANCVDLLIVRKSEKILTEYLLIYLSSWGARTDVAYRSVGAIQAHYNTSTLANLVIPVPPLNEQRAILAESDTELAPIGRSMQAAKDEIVFLREYHGRLIADVVTGKLDVREAAARLTDLADEPAPLLDEHDIERSDGSEVEGPEPVEA